MTDPLAGLSAPPGIHHLVRQDDLYYQRARLDYLVVRIRKMELTHSALTAEIEERVLPRDCTWSQLLFTDLFGPDLKIMADLTGRIECLETNLVRFKCEVRELAVAVECADPR
jgi:hypothetical protein